MSHFVIHNFVVLTNAEVTTHTLSFLFLPSFHPSLVFQILDRGADINQAELG